MTLVLDYGVNNLSSVEKALRRLGADVRVAPEVERADRLVIPGVGAFGAAMEALSPHADAVRRFASSGRPVLGICLGQQLLMDGSDEHGLHKGLGLIPGWVRYLPSCGLKVPHMGWTPVRWRATEPLGTDFPEGGRTYFVHSLYCDAVQSDDIAATAEYGIEFPAALRRGNVWGTQFHPEKSGLLGLKILENWLRC